VRRVASGEMLGRPKNWDRHVPQAEELARSVGFRRIRDRMLTLAQPRRDDVVVDVGSGTGLLTLALAPSVKKVWAIDISPAMTEYVRVKAASAGLSNVETATATATSLPLVDGSASIVVSNYCYHHLRNDDKEHALAEAFRVLRPGGHIVFGDMMFRIQIADRRSRRVILGKVKSILRRGPSGALRLTKNVGRYVTRHWEHPADADWWSQALGRAGFEQIELILLEHEGGIAAARRPIRSSSSCDVAVRGVADIAA
jgi:ubiquinone/menaquinone biosynthesis C-methylase UbiE